MIYRLNITDPTKTPVPWLSKVPALKKPRTLDFTPGLNILWGRNGAGKSTVLKLLARLFHCEQGGVSTVTQASCHEVAARLPNDQPLDGVKVTHDGQAVRHFDPSVTVGVTGGSFDDDFFSAGVTNLMSKGSAGQTVIRRIDGILADVIEGKAPPPIDWRIKRTDVNSLWRARIDAIAAFLTSNANRGPATILFDEPDRSLDLNLQVTIWRVIRAYADSAQFIVASHSLYALNIPEANYIDLSPGYLDGAQKAVKILETWSTEKPSKIERKDPA